MTNPEGTKVYRVTMEYAAYRGFWIQARTPDEAGKWAMENLADWDNFANEYPFFEVYDIRESSSEEARMSFQPVIDTSEYPYEDENEY